MALLLPSILLGCAASPELDEASMTRELERAASSLALRGDADSLAAAALLTTGPHASAALGYSAHADRTRGQESRPAG
jgi:hypothetical protein